MNLQIYEVDPYYIDYLRQYAKHLFHNAGKEQQNSRKYIGIVLEINDLKYFVPLSSFKPKHKAMKETIDFIKVKDYAVLNINNMLPVPEGLFERVNIGTIKDLKYKTLLQAEYREIKKKRNLIVKNAGIVYRHKIKNENNTPLSKRTNDFIELEKACKNYF